MCSNAFALARVATSANPRQPPMPRRSRAGSAAPFPCAGDRRSAVPDLQGVEANVYLTVNLQGGIIFYHEDCKHR